MYIDGNMENMKGCTFIAEGPGLPVKAQAVIIYALPLAGSHINQCKPNKPYIYIYYVYISNPIINIRPPKTMINLG